MNNRKGMFHSLDAFFGGIIILTALVMTMSYFPYEQTHEDLSYVSRDVSEVFSNLMLSEINNTYIDQLVLNETILNPDKSIVRILGELWVENKSGTAVDIVNITLGELFDDKSFSIVFDNEDVVSTGALSYNDLTTTRRLVSGITEGKPVTGISSRIYLTYISNKKNSAYVYFGGFIGQGNVTKSIILPSNITVEDLYLEMASNAPFDVYINDVQCLTTFVPVSTNMSADAWNISSCSGLVDETEGYRNEFSIRFPNVTLQDSYIGGGLIRIGYLTDILLENIDLNSTLDWLPGVNGLVNVYSSLYAPGNLNNMEAYLHYHADHTALSNATFYFTIGNKTIFTDENSTAEQFLVFDNASLSSQLDYQELSSSTFPMRIGFLNFTYETVDVGGNADVILITDRSGSMGWCLDGSSSGCTDLDGDNPDRWELAQYLDKSFINIVLDTPGNRVGLVTYSYRGRNRHSLSDDNESLVAAVEGFPAPSGGTCIGCAIRRAKRMLEGQSNASRDQFIIMMTDGIGNMRTDQSRENKTRCCTEDIGGCSDPRCGNGLYWSGECSDSVDDTAKAWAIADACHAHEATGGAIIHAIGFGPGAVSCAYADDFLDQIAICGNGTKYISTNVSGLEEVYQTIATELVIASTVSQTIVIEGDAINSILYPDSYIIMNYSRDITPSDFGEISLTFESDPFSSCTPSVNVPSQLTVVDVWGTSYSGDHWTDLLSANAQTAFSLSTFGDIYTVLGDPFVIKIPETSIVAGNNNLVFNTGDSPANSTGCSLNNSFIYTGTVSSSVPYTNPSGVAEGCRWTVEYEDGSTEFVFAPTDYIGANTCEYSSSDVSYNTEDAVDIAMFNLLSQFDFDNDNRVDINFDDNDIEIVLTSISQVPFLWGPAIFEVNVWR